VVQEILERLWSPDSWSVAALLAGAYCVATAAGISTGVQISKVVLPAPVTRAGKLFMHGAGLVLILIGLGRALSYPEYKPEVFKRWVYQGKDAKQIVADGEDVYLLRENGNIHTILGKAVSLLDPNTAGTRQILPAGGVLFILKDNGNIWTYQPLRGRDLFRMKDKGTATEQIESAGEALYVLKHDGSIWRSEVQLPGETAPPKDFSRIYDATLPGQIPATRLSSSGSILYVLKGNGNISTVSPALWQPFEEIYRGGDAQWIKADGKALYFVRRDGTPCKYLVDASTRAAGQSRDVDVARETAKCQVIKPCIRAKKIDALGGVAYILTNEGKIFRYNAETDNVRELTEADSNNRDIAAYYQDLFTIDTAGNVRRYLEGRLRR
jgi:hypothetical protein